MRVPRLLARALALRAALPLMLGTLPLDRVLRALADGDRRQERIPLGTLERVTDLITRALPLVRTHCLQRALLRFALLREHGYAPVFVIGVRPGGGGDGFEAHAWVELDGAPVMEREPRTCAPTYVYPAPRPAAG